VGQRTSAEHNGDTVTHARCQQILPRIVEPSGMRVILPFLQRTGVIFSETFFSAGRVSVVLLDMLNERFDVRMLFNPFPELF
jgi:hypothetical protein